MTTIIRNNSPIIHEMQYNNGEGVLREVLYYGRKNGETLYETE
ncbi:hypothetical protein M2145_002150 [Lachnospiraceae bacterium PF1-21]